jgi:hypothetical protein
VDVVTGGEHLPQRPSWDCLACEQPWPCDPAREHLTTEFRWMRFSLSVYMAGQYSSALRDLGPTANIPPDLHERFFAWTRQP